MRSPLLTLAISLAGLAALACGPSDPPPAIESVEAHGGTADTPALAPPTGDTRDRTIYVPAYSHLPAPGGRRALLSITLSVRNVDPSASVTLTQAQYHDTSGRLVRRYLRAPRVLGPLETADFHVDTFDETGGSGANFLVFWEGPSDAHPLLTESVMLGQVGSAYVSFTSRGVELDRPVPRAAGVGVDRAGPDEAVEHEVATPPEGETAP